MRIKISVIVFSMIVLFSSCGDKPALEDVLSITLVNRPSYGMFSEMTDTSITISKSGTIEISIIQVSTEEVISTEIFIISQEEYLDLVQVLIDNKFYKLEEEQPYNAPDCPFYDLKIETTQETYFIHGNSSTGNKNFDNITNAIFSLVKLKTV